MASNPSGDKALARDHKSSDCVSITCVQPALSADEKAEVIRRTRAHIGKARILFAGVVATGYPDALAQAEAAREAGADIAVIFPPEALGGGNAIWP